MSVYNIAVFAISNPVGSGLYELPSAGWHHNLARLICLNAGTSLVALILVPLLPRILISQREGDTSGTA
jgi:hypothetical protein